MSTSPLLRLFVTYSAWNYRTAGRVYLCSSNEEACTACKVNSSSSNCSLYLWLLQARFVLQQRQVDLHKQQRFSRKCPTLPQNCFSESKVIYAVEPQRMVSYIFLSQTFSHMDAVYTCVSQQRFLLCCNAMHALVSVSFTSKSVKPQQPRGRSPRFTKFFCCRWVLQRLVWW